MTKTIQDIENSPGDASQKQMQKMLQLLPKVQQLMAPALTEHGFKADELMSVVMKIQACAADDPSIAQDTAKAAQADASLGSHLYHWFLWLLWCRVDGVHDAKPVSPWLPQNAIDAPRKKSSSGIIHRVNLIPETAGNPTRFFRWRRAPSPTLVWSRKRPASGRAS